MFWYFYVNKWLITKQFAKKTCLIIVTDVNMTSKRAFLQKVTVLLNSTTKKKGFYLKKINVFGVFLSQRSPWIMPSAKQKYSKKWAKLTYPQRKPSEVVTLSEKRQNCQRFHNPKSSSFWENFDEKCSYVLYKSDRRKNWKFEKRRHNED